MATIDTSMYRQNPLRSVADYEGEMLQNDLRKQGVEQNALALQTGRMGIEDRQRAMREADSIRNALSGLGSGATDEARIAALKGTGLPGGFAQADALQKSMLDRQKTVADVGKAQADTQKTQLASGLQKFEIVGQVMSGVRDQATYDMARQQLAQTFGPEMAQNMPPTYDPLVIEQNRAKAMSLKDQMTQRLKEIEFAEQVRHNKAGEGLTARGQGITMRGQDITARGQDMTDARENQRIELARSRAIGPDGQPSKPMPATALKMQNEALDMIGIASSIQADLGAIESQIQGGKLDFGPLENLKNKGLNMAGISSEKSRNLATFESTLEKLRNDSLRLNKGVQTDGDAQRAWNELFKNINDKKLVEQRLKEIKAINARAVELRKREVEDIRNNYNQSQYDFSTQTQVQPALSPAGAPKDITDLLQKYGGK